MCDCHRLCGECHDAVASVDRGLRQLRPLAGSVSRNHSCEMWSLCAESSLDKLDARARLSVLSSRLPLDVGKTCHSESCSGRYRRWTGMNGLGVDAIEVIDGENKSL
jgi:hypothetical protein